MCRVIRLQGFVTAPFEFRARPILFNGYNATLVHDLLHHDLLNLCINRMITLQNKCLCQENVAILWVVFGHYYLAIPAQIIVSSKNSNLLNILKLAAFQIWHFQL